MSVLMVTSLGDLVLDLFVEKCPLTTKNFLKLCMIKYFNGCLFHTVQKDFTAQTGAPTGTETGGNSVYKFLYGEQARFFSDEIRVNLKHSKTGAVSMASAGENLNASQFYITLRDDLDYLDGKHTVFGEVAEGLDTLTRINEAYVDEKNRPYKNIWYEMVFDRDTLENPRWEKRHQGHELDNRMEKRKMSTQNYDRKDRDQEKKEEIGTGSMTEPGITEKIGRIKMVDVEETGSILKSERLSEFEN